MGWLDFLEKWSRMSTWSELRQTLAQAWNRHAHWKKGTISVAAAVALLGLLLVGRWVFWSSYQLDVEPVDGIAVEADEAAWRLAEAIRFKTISHQDPDHFDGKVFIDFHKFLSDSFPRVHKTLERETVSDYSLLYRWQGTKSGLKPLLFLGHLDVVPVTPGTELNWDQSAFTGVIGGGFIWGRGTLDDKGSVLAMFEALEALIAQGYRPERTLYLAFGHDEEVGGYQGAAQIAKLLDERGERFVMSLDEGTSLSQGLIDGLSVPGAIVGVSEKGYLTLRLTARGRGGHSSAPPAHTAVGLIARAITRLEEDPFDARIRPPVTDMMNYLAPELDFLTGVKYANRWLFGGSIRRQMEKSAGSNAMLRTTLAATMTRAGVKENVLPEAARAIINIRIMPGETIAETISRVESVIDDQLVKIESLTAFEPAPVSDPSSESFRALQKTISEIYPDAVVAPGLVRGSTDSKHYAFLADHTYRFKPVLVTPDDLGRVHGTNERIGVDVYRRMIQFYARLFENTAGRGEVAAATADDRGAEAAEATEAAERLAEEKQKEEAEANQRTQAIKKARAEAKRKKAKARAKKNVEAIPKPIPKPEVEPITTIKSETPEQSPDEKKPETSTGDGKAEKKTEEKVPEKSPEKTEEGGKTDADPPADEQPAVTEPDDTEPDDDG